MNDRRAGSLKTNRANSGLRRVLIVSVIYLVASLVVVAGAGFLGRLLKLPGLFNDIVIWGAVCGLPLAGLLAWKYPVLGHHGRAREENGPPYHE